MAKIIKIERYRATRWGLLRSFIPGQLQLVLLVLNLRRKLIELQLYSFPQKTYNLSKSVRVWFVDIHFVSKHYLDTFSNLITPKGIYDNRRMAEKLLSAFIQVIIKLYAPRKEEVSHD